MQMQSQVTPVGVWTPQLRDRPTLPRLPVVRAPHRMQRWYDAAGPLIEALGGSVERAYGSTMLRRLLTKAAWAEVEDRVVKRWREQNWPRLWHGLEKMFLAESFGIQHIRGLWSIQLRSEHGDLFRDYGLASAHLMTDDGAEDVVDAFQNLLELELHRFHGLGLDNTAPAVTDAALVSELSGGQYTAGTRASGTQTENTAKVYETVGDNQIAVGALSIVEAGIFTQAALAGGRMLDRGTFGAVTPAAGQIVRTTYDHTVNSGGT